MVLVEFRVKNFRSLRDEQVLSLVASPDPTFRSDNTLATGIQAAPFLLRSVAIYGANASGKSNLIKALQFMRGVVVESASLMQPGQKFSVQPFRLNSSSTGQPSEFEVTILVDGVRYQYGFSLDAERIVSEHLLVYRAFKPQRWFERWFDEITGRDVYQYGPGLRGPKKLWEEATRPNSLYLSMAVQLNSEALRPVFDWFLRQLRILNEVTPLAPNFTVSLLRQPDRRAAIRDFLRSADISLSEIELESRRVPGRAVHMDVKTGNTEVRDEDVEAQRLRFHHVTEQGRAVFELQDESSGTRALLFLTGPVLDVLEKGRTLVVDELDTSLHTLLLRELVGLFHRPEINASGAQLVFTTHDTSLLSAFGLFRRDQIALVEQDVDQASELVWLSDFSPRKNEALERGYLSGRYGGVPLLQETLGMAR